MVSGKKILLHLQRLSISLTLTPFQWDADLDIVLPLGWAYLGFGPICLELNW